MYVCVCVCVCVCERERERESYTSVVFLSSFQDFSRLSQTTRLILIINYCSKDLNISAANFTRLGKEI